MNEQKLIDDLNSALFSSPDAYSVLVEIREILGRHKAAASSAQQEVKQAEPVYIWEYKDRVLKDTRYSKSALDEYNYAPGTLPKPLYAAPPAPA